MYMNLFKTSIFCLVVILGFLSGIFLLCWIFSPKNCSPENRFEWHTWFAWHPVITNNGIAWLKEVQAKDTKICWVYND